MCVKLLDDVEVALMILFPIFLLSYRNWTSPPVELYKLIVSLFVSGLRPGLWLLSFSALSRNSAQHYTEHISAPLFPLEKTQNFSVCKVIYAYLEILLKKVNSRSLSLSLLTRVEFWVRVRQFFFSCADG